jgi:hypothetical protein
MMDEVLDAFRLDVDEAMALAQGDKSVAIWKSIEADLVTGGPFSEMLKAFRRDAVRALSDIVYADSNDAVRISALQADIQRSLRTMELIDEFKGAAEASLANADINQSDEVTVITIPEED